MKKFLLLTLGLGIFAVSCGTKESQMSSSKTDSAATVVDTVKTVPPVTTDTMNTKMTNPDTIKIRDTVAAPVTK